MTISTSASANDNVFNLIKFWLIGYDKYKYNLGISLLDSEF